MGEKKMLRKNFETAQGRGFAVTLAKITGAGPGPVLTVIGGQHGMEHIGPVILTELIDEIRPDDFTGTLYICPCANPLALALDYEFYPEGEDLAKLNDYYYSRFRHYHCVYGEGREDRPKQKYNMNRFWNAPGDTGVAGDVTKWLWTTACADADVIIDFHCLQAEKPLIFIGDPKAKEIAKYFGIQVLYTSGGMGGHGLAPQANTKEGRYGFTAEFSLQHGYKLHEYDVGRKGVSNIMKALEMMEGEVVHEKPVYSRAKNVDFAAEAVGHIHYRFDEYEPVNEGDVIFEIRNIETLDVMQRAVSPLTGIMGQRTHRPVSRTGEKVCEVCGVDVLAEAGVPLGKFKGLS